MQTAGLKPPRTLTIAVTELCNLSCRHCWVKSGPGRKGTHVPRLQVERIITEHISTGGREIRFTGGEPLCHPDIRKLLAFACSCGLSRVILQTNGHLLNHTLLKTLQQALYAPLWLEISLDGATAESHDYIRGSGSFAGISDLLRQLKRTGLSHRTTLQFTEMHHNLGEFPRLLQLAERYAITEVRAGTLVRGGRAGTGSSTAAPLPQQYRELARRYRRDTLFRQTYDRIGTMAALEWLKNPTERTGCCSFAEDTYLTADGRLYPCRMCHSDHHSVRRTWHKGLPAALREAMPFWAALQRQKAERCRQIRACRTCGAADACSAGCMGRALASCGSLDAADDRCEIRRAVLNIE